MLTRDADIVMHIYNIRYSLNMLKAATDNNVSRLVMVHTTGIYSKYKMASGEYKKIECQIDNFLEKSNVDVTILRPTMIFGDLCDHNIHKFIKMVDKFPLMPEIDHGLGKIRPVNARDLAKVYYTVCTTMRLPELRYDISGEMSLTLHQLFDMIGTYLGKEVHYCSCPMWIGTFLARCLKIVTFGKIDLVEKILRMGEDRDYDHVKATRDFGYAPESFQIGLKREVEQYIKGRS